MSRLSKARDAALIPAVIRGASAIVSDSDFTAGLVQAWVNKPLRMKTMPMGPGLLDLETIRIERRSERSEVTLLSVGRLVARKGHSEVLRAIAILSKKFMELRYVVVGDGPQKAALEKQAGQLGLDDHLPSLREVEGFGIVYLEASAFGLPVVATRSGGIPEAVLHDHTGLLVDPSDPEDLTIKLQRLISDPDLRLRLGRDGRKRVLTEMNWDRSVEMVMQLQRSVLAERR